MSIFGGKPDPKITEYELRHEHVLARFDSVLAHHPKNVRDQKRAMLHTALTIASDADRGMGREARGIRPEEFHAIVDSLHTGGIISESEAAGLRKVAEKPLKD